MTIAVANTNRLANRSYDDNHQARMKLASVVMPAKSGSSHNDAGVPHRVATPVASDRSATTSGNSPVRPAKTPAINRALNVASPSKSIAT